MMDSQPLHKCSKVFVKGAVRGTKAPARMAAHAMSATRSVDAATQAPVCDDEEFAVVDTAQTPLERGAAKPPFAVAFVAGGLSGTLGALATNPLEVVKTRMQSSAYAGTHVAGGAHRGPLGTAAAHVAGTCRILARIGRTEGVRALWRGTGATLLGVMPSRAVYFATYAWAKEAVARSLNGGDDTAWWVHLPAGFAAGVVVATATNPLWLVKTRMQLQGTAPDGSPARYASTLACARAVVAAEGVRGLYRGMTASYLGAAEGMAQWALYEQLKAALARARVASTKNALDAPLRADAHLRPLDFFLAAAGAKLVAAVAAYPHEVLRTRLREDGPSAGLLGTARTILRREGPAGFYGGMTAHLMRTVPNAAIMFFSYECILMLYRRAALPSK